MADVRIYVPFLLSWEGGYVNDPRDSGGATKYGVTVGTWRQYGYDKNGDGVINEQDVRMITEDDAVGRILKPKFWDRWSADRIRSQSIANLVVDWLYNSGLPGITNVQKILGVTADGVVGEKTLSALNAREPRSLFNEIHQRREDYFRNLKKFPIYGRGWLNRNSSIGWGWLRTNELKPKIISFES